METSLDLLAWRVSLGSARTVPLASDLAAWAERLAGAGAQEEASLLSDVAALHRGFPSDMTQVDSALGPRWTPQRAMDELHLLASDFSIAGLPSLVPSKSPALRDHSDIKDESDAQISVLTDVVSIARMLRMVLGGALVKSSSVAATLGNSLAMASKRLPSFDYRSYSHSSIDLLVPAIATVGLFDWALATHDLVRAPLGSPDFLHRAASLSEAGLGPYFRNVGYVTRDAADVFDLARIAAKASGVPDRRDAVGAWTVQLSRGCRAEQMRELIDELGDHGAHDVLSGILDRLIVQLPSVIDIDIVLRIRDAALDNGDYRLAVRAQKTVVRLSPESRLNGMILGDLEASRSEFARAEAIFRYWFEQSPDNDIRARLVAVERNRFDEFRVTRGFGSPAVRQEKRLRRRGIPPDYPSRRGERLTAVDVR